LPVDLKTLTPDTTVPSTAVLFGADSQAATDPSVYPLPAVRDGVNVGDVILTDAPFISWNVETSRIATVTLGGNRTLLSPTNHKDGGEYKLLVFQDDTGGRTLAYDSNIVWPGGTAPNLSGAAANSLIVITLVSDGVRLYATADQTYTGNSPTLYHNFASGVLPSWLTFSRAGHATMTDSSGNITWAPNNMLLNSATLSTQSVATAGGHSNILSFRGTGSVTLSGSATGTLAGTGVNNRVSLVITPTAGSLTLTVTGQVLDAQLERVTYETAPRAYNPTTGVAFFGPRFDWTGGTPGLHIEGARTNVIANSEGLSTGSNCTITSTPNALFGGMRLYTATQTADNLPTAPNLPISGGGQAVVNGNRVTVSGAFLAGTNKTSAFFGAHGSVSGWGVNGDTTAVVLSGPGSITQSSGGLWTISGLSLTIPTVVSITRVYNVSENAIMLAYLEAGPAGLAGNSIRYGLLQQELGNGRSSYIPTFGASVTRALEAVNMVGSVFSSVWNATEGSMITQTSLTSSSPAQGIWSANSGSGTNRIDMRANFGSITTVGGVSQAEINIGIDAVNTAARRAVAWRQNDFAAVRNGGTVVTDVAGNIPTVTQLQIGGIDAQPQYELYGLLQSIAYYNRRIPNSALQAKSTLGANY
jgi:hypothetical protein